MNRKIFIILSAILIAGAIFSFMKNSNQEQNEEQTVEQSEAAEEMGDTGGDFLTINGHRLNLEVMRTQEEQIWGLSGRESLNENAGMLFVYEEPVVPSFWMKDMNFSIDIIWIGSDRKIVDITENIAPETYPNTFRPKAPIQYVLEVNAGWALDRNVAVGDMIQF